jgi:hypothetical protein
MCSGVMPDCAWNNNSFLNLRKFNFRIFYLLTINHSPFRSISNRKRNPMLVVFLKKEKCLFAYMISFWTALTFRSLNSICAEVAVGISLRASLHSFFSQRRYILFCTLFPIFFVSTIYACTNQQEIGNVIFTQYVVRFIQMF